MDNTSSDRRNFLCLVWVGAVFAMGWAEVMVVLQPLLVHLGASNTQIGLVQGSLIAALPGMFLAPWITRLFRRKKIYLYVLDTLYLLPVGLIGALVWSGVCANAATVLVAIVWLMVASQLAAGFGGLPNQEFFAACIPMRLRGRLAGWSASIGGFLGLGSAGFAAWALAQMPVPQGYGALLVLAWLLCQIADSGILFAREPDSPVEKSPPPYSLAMWRTFFRDSAFCKVTLLVCLIHPLMGQLAIYASVIGFKELNFRPEMAAAIVFVAKLAQMSLSAVAGWATDRFGAWRMLLVWPLLTVLGFADIAFYPCYESVMAASALAAVAWSGFSGAMNALIAGIPAPEHRPGHFTVFSFCLIIAGALGPVLAGATFDTIGYRFGFSLVSFLLLSILLGGYFLLHKMPNSPHKYH